MAIIECSKYHTTKEIYEKYKQREIFFPLYQTKLFEK
jgi:hypothetical protein